MPICATWSSGSRETYRGRDYKRTQAIGDAAFFLGFDGILAPSARWNCRNLVVVCDRFAPADLTVVESVPVDWNDWRARRIALRANDE